jgi:MFS family permease
VGSVLAPYISDYYGRRMVIFIGGLLATLGAALQGGAISIAMLIAGRFIAGLAIGQMSATIPVYCVRAAAQFTLPTISDVSAERGCAAANSRHVSECTAVDDWVGDHGCCKTLSLGIPWL